MKLNTFYGLSLLITPITLVACGRAPIRNVGVFEPNVAVFEVEMASVGSTITVDDIVIRWSTESETQGNILATCSLSSYNTPLIVVKQSYWLSVDDTLKQLLIDHELGHCVLMEGHRTDVQGLCPRSIMYPFALSERCFNASPGAYLSELWSNSLRQMSMKSLSWNETIEN